MSGATSDQLHRSTLSVYLVSLYCLLVLYTLVSVPGVDKLWCTVYLNMARLDWLWWMSQISNLVMAEVKTVCNSVYVWTYFFLCVTVEPDGALQSWPPEACCSRKQLCQSFPRWVTLWVTGGEMCGWLNECVPVYSVCMRHILIVILIIFIYTFHF